MFNDLQSALIALLTALWQLPYGEWIVASLPVLYLLYVQLMRWEQRLEREKGLPWHGWILYYAIQPPFFVLDVLWNLLASLPFRDLPREWTLSARLNRYTLQAHYEGTWREQWALTIAPVLNAHAPDHIRRR